MVEQSPMETVNELMKAINKSNLEAALALYEPQATLMMEPGKPATGTTALRQALQGFISLKPTLKGEKNEVIQVGDLALFCSKWTLSGTGPDGKPVTMNGKSSDILRRHSDGRWLIVVDNPWGTGILG